MGLMDFLSSAVQSAVDSVKEGDISGIAQGNLIGNKMLQDQKLAAQKLENRPKPGKLCHKLCPVNDMRCEACLSEQQNILAALENLENLEQAISNSQTRGVLPLADKCSVCGAPFEKGEKECPYCGTAYPKSRAADIPATELERDRLLLEKSAEAFALYSELYKKQIVYKAENPELPSIVKNMMKLSKTMEEKNMVMTSEQIRQGAQSNGVSYAAYISGVMAGVYKSIPQINMERQTAALQQRSAELTKQSQEMNAQMVAQQRAREQQSRQENAQRQAQMASSKSYGYSGGASRTCYNCTYYSAGAQACAMNGRSTNAGDYCGCWKLK